MFWSQMGLVAPLQQHFGSTNRTIRWIGTYLGPSESSQVPLKWAPCLVSEVPGSTPRPSQTRTKHHRSSDSSVFYLRSALVTPLQQHLGSTSRTIRWIGTYL